MDHEIRILAFEAAKSNDFENIKKFININNINDTDYFGNTVFIVACKYGHLQIVEFLANNFKNININYKGNFGKTAFIYTCQFGHVEIANFLINNFKDIDLHIKDTNGDTAFTCACSTTKGNRESKIIDFLIKNIEIDINHKNNCGETALHIACFYQNLDMVELLVGNFKNINVNLENRDGYTVFDIAHHSKNYRIVKLLTDMLT